VFNLGSIDSRIAPRTPRRSHRESYDALQRNLASEVHEALLSYNEAVEQNKVATRGLESRSRTSS